MDASDMGRMVRLVRTLSALLWVVIPVVAGVFIVSGLVARASEDTSSVYAEVYGTEAVLNAAYANVYSPDGEWLGTSELNLVSSPETDERLGRFMVSDVPAMDEYVVTIGSPYESVLTERVTPEWHPVQLNSPATALR